MIKFPIFLSVQPCSWSVVFHMGKMEHSKTLLMCCDYLITTWWRIDHSCKCVRPERQVVLGVWNDVSSYCVWKYAEMGDISDIFLFLLHLNMFIRRFAGFVHFQKWWKDCFHWKSVVETTKKTKNIRCPANILTRLLDNLFEQMPKCLSDTLICLPDILKCL